MPKFTELKDKIDIQVSSVVDEQSLKQKYEHEPFKDIGDNVRRTVHEYLTPSGEVGLQVIFERKEGEDRYLMSTATGDERDSRTFDWTLISPHG